jgi:hypothetical protein
MNFETPSANKEAPEYWLKKAEAKVRTFLHEVDPELRVNAEIRFIREDNGIERFDAVLMFRHPTDPRLEWSMDIGRNNEYIDQKLETVVRNTYKRKKQENEAGN